MADGGRERGTGGREGRIKVREVSGRERGGERERGEGAHQIWVFCLKMHKHLC